MARWATPPYPTAVCSTRCTIVSLLDDGVILGPIYEIIVMIESFCELLR